MYDEHKEALKEYYADVLIQVLMRLLKTSLYAYDKTELLGYSRVLAIDYRLLFTPHSITLI